MCVYVYMCMCAFRSRFSIQNFGPFSQLTVQLSFKTVKLSIALEQLQFELTELLDSFDINSTIISRINGYVGDAIYVFRGKAQVFMSYHHHTYHTSYITMHSLLPCLPVVFPAGPTIAFVWNLVIMVLMIRAVR